MTQDKRNIKCFIQSNTITIACPHDRRRPSGRGGNRISCSRHLPSLSTTGQSNTDGLQVNKKPIVTFVAIDLYGVRSAKELDAKIKSRILTAEISSESTRQEAHESSTRWSISYCTLDGRRRPLHDVTQWLSFCANVCHLTAHLSQDID